VATDSGETIARGTVSRNIGSGRFEFGAEAAINTLDGAQRLTVDSAPVSLPNANLNVKETRGEGFASHVWRIDSVWSLDSRLAVESSRLSFTGDTEKSVSLTYVKPRVQLTRQLGPHQLQLRVFRDVGQLDFNDFVTTTSFANDLVEGGNPDLRPQTAWAAEIETDLRFPGDAALRIRAFRHFVSDVVDFVPVGEPGEQFDAPGNIGDGRIIGAEITARVPLKVVLPGDALNIAGTWQDTDVKDPLTGTRRMFSDTSENHLRAELRQDLNAARIAWGASYEAYSMNSEFRLGEINRFRELHRLDVFVETTVVANMKLRLEAQSALNGAEKRDRRLYAPDRLGSLVRRDLGGYLPGHWGLLTVSSHF
jgi:outer membrane receptor protein involved in Fe transport